jgi:UDP-3-O-[3-hydroxymyristoyl] N-acetylglucosamine deacetylase
MASYRQTTLAAEVLMEGVGLHTGRTVHMALKPAPPETGVVFVSQGVRIPANIQNAAQHAARNTTLQKGDAALHTVEHVLAALSGLCVDNAVVELDGPEPPAMDGGALPLCRAMRQAGIRELDADMEYFTIKQPVFVEDPGRAAAAALPHHGFRVTFLIGYNHPLVHEQSFDADITPDSFSDTIAPARTYGFIEEVDALRSAGLALGGSEDNAIVIYPDRFSTDLRMPNELAAHKALDMIGDLALLGRRVRGHFIGYRSGHALNARLVRALIEQACQG